MIEHGDRARRRSYEPVSGFARKLAGGIKAAPKPMEVMAEGVVAEETAEIPSEKIAMRGGHGNYNQAPLSGGEIDDNALYSKFLNYTGNIESRIRDACKPSSWERHIIQVRDHNGRYVFDALLTVERNGMPVAMLKTYTDGRAVFIPGFYGDQNTQGDYTLRVVSVNGVRIQRRFDVDDFGVWWNITLPHDYYVPDRVGLDIMFVIDTTGSMADEINQLKKTIHEIAARLSDLPRHPDIRFGMVIYRDRGDAYLTRVYDFVDSVDDFSLKLSTVTASGGGDMPEDLNAALEDAIERASWRINEPCVRVIVLVADAPPHMDYGEQYDYRIAALRSQELGIKIFPIASSGLDDRGEYIFRQLALLTMGRFVFITYGGSTPHHVSPSDYTVQTLHELIIRLISREFEVLGGGQMNK